MKSFPIRRREFLISGAAAVAAAAAPAAARSKLRMTIVTGGTGGVFYPYGGGLAKVLSERGGNVQATAQVTGGSVDNIKLVAAGEAELGFATIDIVHDALHGTGAFASEGAQPVRLAAVLYDSIQHVVANADAGVRRVADLKGRRIGVGSAGSGTEVLANRVLTAAGLDPAKDVTRDNLSVTESVGALKDGKIAAFFWIGGLPTAAVRDLATSGAPPIIFLPTDQEVATLQKTYPDLYRSIVLPRNTYEGMTGDVPGLGVSNVLVTAENAPSDMIETCLATIFDNLEAVRKLHPEARKLALKDAAARMAVPFHPAAAAFYKARGAV